MTRADDRPRADWTQAEAIAADEQYRRSHPPGPESPFFQWFALNDIERMRARIEGGDGFAVLGAVRDCANHGLAMPEWLARQFIRRYDAVLNRSAGSWDDVFGRPVPKGKHLATMRRDRMLRLAVYQTVNASHLPIGPELFDQVGRELGLARVIVERLYYEAKRMLGEPRGRPPI